MRRDREGDVASSRLLYLLTVYYTFNASLGFNADSLETLRRHCKFKKKCDWWI